MSHPQVICHEVVHEEDSDWVIIFQFDGDLLPDPSPKMEFDRSQYLNGQPEDSIYADLPQPLIELIKLTFGFPRLDPHRHIRISRREVTVTLDPSPWDLDLDPISHFTWHYRKLCGLPVGA